jgi:hypothetical protein
MHLGFAQTLKRFRDYFYYCTIFLKTGPKVVQAIGGYCRKNQALLKFGAFERSYFVDP